MMDTYKVQIREVTIYEIDVEAGCEEEAIETANDDFDSFTNKNVWFKGFDRENRIVEKE